MVRIGVIGAGHWGPNHIRIFSQLPNSKVEMCADLSEDRLKMVNRLFSSVHTTRDYREILKSEDIDAVCIAAPTALHFKLTKEALEHRKHVLCEKPLALDPKECLELKKIARKYQRHLMVGHIFVFNEGIRLLKQYIQSGQLGKIYYAHSEWTNLGPFRYDVNALWDLAPHDVSIFNYLFDAPPLTASARGQKYLNKSREDVAFATLEYQKNILVNIHVSWLDPKKVRQITIVGDKKMIVWDDLDNLGPVRLYDKHVERTATFYESYGEFQLLSKEGSIMIPKVGINEPLKNQRQYFVDCVDKNKAPSLCDAQKGFEVVQTLCSIQESMNHQGKPVKIKK